MPFPIDIYLKEELEQRLSDNSYRYLYKDNSLLDFCSNDYLGFARSVELKDRIDNFPLEEGNSLIGSTGSRLLTGNSAFAEELEAYVAQYHHAEAGLIYNSGYVANLGLLSCLLHKEHTVVYDALVHISIHHGMQLGKASPFPFRHNDLNHLEELLKGAKGILWVLVESVYSMDGDFAPLEEIVSLCERYGAHLIVDEAHATGLYGVKGEGRVVELGLEARVFARVHTFGKALGCHGAIVVGGKTLREYLINYSRTFIYTTALPPHSLISIRCAYELLSKSSDKVEHIKKLIRLFKSKMLGVSNAKLLDSPSPIQGISIAGNEKIRRVAHKVQQAGFDVRPILSPTVPKGTERLRICLHAFNTAAQTEALVTTLQEIVTAPI